MRKKSILLIIIMFLFLIIIGINSKVEAADLDEIVNFDITVEPRTNDGTLDITYEVTWKVLDSTTEGPLEWVMIGTPNSNFDTPTALTSNIKKIQKYNGSNVRIDLDKKYYKGEQVTFKYSIHQSYIYRVSGGDCNYEFTPAWFTGAEVDKLTIRWNKDKVKESDAKDEEGNYLIWKKTSMKKGEKITAKVKYDKTSFSSLIPDETENDNEFDNGSFGLKFLGICLLIGIVLGVISGIFSRGMNNRYYRHRGFYYGGPHRGCVRSSCACACAHSSCASSCACACAGSGRAGCSRKDFYGTNLNREKLDKAMSKNR